MVWRLRFLNYKVNPMIGESEMDQSHFGARRIKGECGVFGFGHCVRPLQGQWPGHTGIVPDRRKAALQVMTAAGGRRPIHLFGRI